MNQSCTLSHAINEATILLSFSHTPKLDAELLLGFCLGQNRTWIRTWPERCLTHIEYSRYQALIAQRSAGVPLAYITGRKEFWSRLFTVGPDVLIPRPETETLVEQALKLITLEKEVTILDLGTGSGIIAITLASERPNARILAVDRSQAALDIAFINCLHHGTSNVTFQQSDWFDSVSPNLSFDLIVSNPPYIPSSDPHLCGDGIRFEPREALISGFKGLDDIIKIIHGSLQFLRPNGYLLLEHGYTQAAAVAQLMSDSGFSDVRHFLDLLHLPRVTQSRLV